MGGEESGEICEGRFGSFLLICGGYVDVLGFRGVFVASKSKGNVSFLFWICSSVKWSPLASIPGSFFSVDSESMIDRGWSIDFKFVVCCSLIRQSPLQGIEIEIDRDPVVFVVIWIDNVVSWP